MNVEFSEKTFRGYLDFTAQDVGDSEPLLYHTIHIEDFWHKLPDPFVIYPTSSIRVSRGSNIYELNGTWITLNDFPENYYGSLRLTFRGSILRGRRFLIYINKASSIASTVYYHGIEVDRQFPIYDDYPALEIDNIFSRSPNSGSILLKGNQRFRFIFTSRIPFDMIRSFEFVSHGDKCIKTGKHCKERNLTKEERRNIFKHLFGLRTALLLQHWGIYEQANQLFLGANFSSVEDGIAHIRALQDLLSNRERQLQNKS